MVPLFLFLSQVQLATAVQLEPPWSLEATFGLCFSPSFLARTPNVFPRRTPGTAKTATAAGFSSINFIRRLLLWAGWQQLWRKGGCGVAGCERGGFRVGGAVENRRSWRRRRRRVGWRNKQQTSRRSGRRSERGWVVRRGGGRGLPQGLLGEQSCDALFFSRPQLAPVLFVGPAKRTYVLDMRDRCFCLLLMYQYIVGLLKKPVACDCSLHPVFLFRAIVLTFRHWRGGSSARALVLAVFGNSWVACQKNKKSCGWLNQRKMGDMGGRLQPCP